MAEALNKELPSDGAVALNRGVRQALLVLQVVPKGGGNIVGRHRRHAGLSAHAKPAQVAKQVDQLASFLLPRGDADGLAHSPPSVLVLGEMNLAEILKINSLCG
jgi:hypothetical protein